MDTFLQNRTIVAALAAMLAAQLFKIVFNLIFTGKLDMRSGIGTGGMPSSHASTVSAVTVSVGLLEGVESVTFALTLVLSVIVIFDAVGIRRAAGKHAELLNEWSKILSEIYEHGFKPEDLRTLLGHTYPQVAAGVVLGTTIGFLMHMY